MYSDFFDQIDAARNGRRGGRSSDAAIIPETPPLVSFKAGKMKLVEQPTGSYKCEPDTSRGEVRLVYNTFDNLVQWQWYDRRTKKVVDKYPITEEGSTFERIDLSPNKKHKNDRIYVWTSKNTEGIYKYDMYWMQDISDEKDDEIVAQVNQYLADLASAAPEGATPPIVESTNNDPSSAATGTSGSANQIDALSSILENLGMPQSDVDATTPATSGGSSSAPIQLTLADLQGAMQGIQAQQQQQASSVPGPPLNELVTSEAITAILESDDAVKQRLIQMLPEGQQTEESLADNLRSPQVQQTLRTLTQALLPDDNGDLSGYASVIANFNLDPADGQDALTSGNPIQAFLDCIIKSVEKEQKEEKAEEDENNNNEGKEEE